MSGSTSRAQRRRQARARAGRARILAVVAAGAVVIALVVVIVVTGSDSGDDSSSATDRSGSPSAVGDPAPDMSFAMLDGTSASLADYRGTPVVMNFFASWCAPCLAEMPDFERVHQSLGDEVAFLGVNLQDTPDAARSVVERTGVTYDIATDPDGAMFTAIGGVGMPTTVLIDASGAIVELRTGAMTADELTGKVEQLLARGT